MGNKLERDQKEPTDGGKRKLQLADQKPQEIAADAKRPRLVIDFPERKPPPFPVTSIAQSNQNLVENKKIPIPEGKVGLLIGKGGETIKQINLQSGAYVRIANDHKADLDNVTRDVDLTGTSEQLRRAEELINAAISDKPDAAPSTVHGVNVNKSEGKKLTVEVKVPSHKVPLLIGKGGETVKYMQRKTGTGIKIADHHLHPGNPSTERILHINGTTEQIEAAKQLVNDVINGKRILEPPVTSSDAQPAQLQLQPQCFWHQPTDVSYYGQTRYETGQMIGYGYYGQKLQMGYTPFGPSYGYSQQAPNYAGNVTAQAELQRPCGLQDEPVSSQSTEPESAYSPFWWGQGAEPPASWQTDSGYDPAVHCWDQTPQVPSAESQQPSKNGQSRSPATRPETRDENP